jgi:hypothetical protein
VTTFYTYLEPTPRKTTPGRNQEIVAGCEAVRTNVAEIIASALDKLAKLRRDYTFGSSACFVATNTRMV